MFETVAIHRTRNDLKCGGKFPRAIVQREIVQRMSVVVLLLMVALMTTSCGTVAQAAGSQSDATPTNLSLYGAVPAAKVHEPYSALFGVAGGVAPYHFSVKTGSLPPGVTMSPTTGTLSGKPTATGTFEFEMIVTDSPHLDIGTHLFSVTVAAAAAALAVAARRSRSVCLRPPEACRRIRLSSSPPQSAEPPTPA